MKLYLYGHEYKYAAEQMLLTMFPGERPEYPEGKPEGDHMVLRLSRAQKYTTASCRLVLDGIAYTAMARAENSQMRDELLT
ncbi:MAG: coproporphyrinogen dehydrogenase HemZ, partial [Oscillospiraceae bacterium]|nr:coproporphyrinogen dehydrogenase HemZ [Oscillospiraceae bacterium]